MFKEINHNGIIIKYELEYKKVKNINLRIKPDGSIKVSANKRVSEKLTEAFVLSKAEFILKALEKNNSKVKTEYFTENELRETVLAFCKKVFPYYEKLGVEYPEIKFRKMVSRWGSCHIKKGILTFNIGLMYAPRECVEYVVYHEFTHFLQANHSKLFYSELAKVCPNWKECRKKLREIRLE